MLRYVKLKKANWLHNWRLLVLKTVYIETGLQICLRVLFKATEMKTNLVS